MGGGHITGYHITDVDTLAESLSALGAAGLQKSKYGRDAGILMAVGDGNHSLAAAKKWWDMLKQSLSAEDRRNHPARYALCEVVNIYDEAMLFEPIHRVLLDIDERFIDALRHRLHGGGSLKVFTKNIEYVLDAPDSVIDTVKTVQAFIEEYINSMGGQVDYVHGEDHLAEVVEDNDAIGVLMPQFPKEELFSYILNVGNLPKKAFSIGSPEYKRYYLEAKAIK